MTTIEWTDRTWNPTRGCTRVSSGCENCYAERVARRFDYPGGSYEGLTTSSGRWNGVVRLIPEKLREPLRWWKPCRVFVDSMSDLFHPSIPDEFIDRVFGVTALMPHHTYQVLTKRPERMAEYFAASHRFALIEGAAQKLYHDRSGEDPDMWLAVTQLPNVWLGVSVEDQATVDERVPRLLEIPAAIRFLSCEPLLAPLDLVCLWASPHRRAIDWVIVGGESGPGARRCGEEWVRSTVEQCRESDTPCFVKQLGLYWSRLHGKRSRTGADPTEWPEDLRVRAFP